MLQDVRAVLCIVGVSVMLISLYIIRGYISRYDRTKLPELTLNDTGKYFPQFPPLRFHVNNLYSHDQCQTFYVNEIKGLTAVL